MRIVVSVRIFYVLVRTYTVGTLYRMVLHVNGVADVRKRGKNEQTHTNTFNSKWRATAATRNRAEDEDRKCTQSIVAVGRVYE